MPNDDIRYIKGYSHSGFEQQYQRHSVLEAKTVEYLQKAGFYIESAPYHKTFSDEIQKTLHTNFDVNGIYIRSRADRVIVHKTTGFTCQLEIKTARYADPSTENDRDSLFLEILPLALHIYNSRVGIKTLYVHSDPSANHSAAFWADDTIIRFIKEIRIPPKHGINRDYYEKKLREIFGEHTPAIRLTEKLSKRGSNDPYAVMDFPGILKVSNHSLLAMLKTAIDEYVMIRPRPVYANCAACDSDIDWSKSQLCPDGCGQMVSVATMCNGCYEFFCDKQCFEAHIKGRATPDTDLDVEEAGAQRRFNC